MQAVNMGYNPDLLKKGMLAASEAIVELIKEYSTDVTDEDLKNVATISANGDSGIGETISDAIRSVGADGIVIIEESTNGETKYEVVDGMELNRGYKSPYFVTDEGRMLVGLTDVDILLINHRLGELSDQLVAVFEHAITNKRGLLIIAEDFDEKVLATMIVNRSRGVLKVCAVKAPDYGESRTHILEDIATVTGATVLDNTKGMTWENFDMDWLGEARKVTVSRDTTVIVDGAGDSEGIKERVANIKTQIETATSFYDIERLQDRLAKLVGGVAVIQVGGINESDMLERKDRFEDALFATKAAMDQGILPGGGVIGLAIKENLKASGVLERHENHGYRMVIESLPIFIKTILKNAGYSEDQVIDIIRQIREGKDGIWSGVDVNSGEIISYKTEGIIDPTKVVKSVIETATAIAANVLTIEGVIAVEEDKKEESFNFGN
jgi:chaperonin GroEL